MGCCFSSKNCRPPPNYIEVTADSSSPLPNLIEVTADIRQPVKHIEVVNDERADWLQIFKAGEMTSRIWSNIEHVLKHQMKIHLFVNVVGDQRDRFAYTFEFSSSQSYKFQGFRLWALQDISKMSYSFYLLDVLKYTNNIYMLITMDRHVVLLPKHDNDPICQYIDNGPFSMTTCLTESKIECVCACSCYTTTSKWDFIQGILRDESS